MNKNEIIDECIDTIKKLIRFNCDDHTPFRGPCSTCGNYHNPKILPDPEYVIIKLQSLKDK